MMNSKVLVIAILAVLLLGHVSFARTSGGGDLASFGDAWPFFNFSMPNIGTGGGLGAMLSVLPLCTSLAVVMFGFMAISFAMITEP